MPTPPVPAGPERSGPPSRGLSTQEMEAVIRRASELQARTSDASHDGVTEAELLRIGREIGLAPEHVQRALAEVRAGGGAVGRTESALGEGRVSAGRTVRGSADGVAADLDRYMRERECLAVLRRYPERTVYEKERGLRAGIAMASEIGRTLGDAGPRVGAGFQLRKVRQVEVAVAALDEEVSHVTLSADLTNLRTGYLAGAAVGGGGSAAVVAAVAAIAIAPPAALVALPVLGGIAWGTWAGYRAVAERARLHLEALLDAMERGEPLMPATRRGPFGF